MNPALRAGRDTTNVAHTNNSFVSLVCNSYIGIAYLVGNVRHQGQVAGALDSFGYSALVMRADRGNTVIDDPCVGVGELFQGLDIFIVDGFDSVVAKVTVSHKLGYRG